MTKSTIKVSPRLAVIVGLALVTVAITVTGAVQRLSSVAGTALQSGVVANAAPSVDAVIPSDASGSGSVALPAPGFTLNEGATRTLYVRGTVSDPNGCEDVSSVQITAYRPGVAYGGTDGMNAAGVLGQGGSFTTGAVNFDGVTANGLKTPYDVAIDTTGRHLFVADVNNNRVLVYDLNADGTPSDWTADHVLGQASFGVRSQNRGTGVNANTMKFPSALAWDAAQSRLFVSDQGNSRVLVFDLSAVAGITDGMDASYALGQANFTSGAANRGGAIAANTLNGEYGLAWDAASSRLFVGDFANNRVLSYDLAAGISNGMAASHVLGQANFASGTANRGGAIAANTLYGVGYLAWDGDGGRLFVGDGHNNRVLSYDLSEGVIDGMSASHVLGQADFASGAANRGGSAAANSIGIPMGIAWNAAASRLFVADFSNARILSYDLATGLTDGMAASHVLGQADFTSGTVNRGGAVAANTLYSAGGLTWDPVHNRLFATDNNYTGNNRVLWYNLDAGSACTLDANNCYTASVAKGSLVGCTGAGDTDATFEAAIPVANFADPTDAGSPYAFQAWKADAVVTDAATLAGTLSVDFEVQSLAAFSVAPSLMDYGTIALGATSAQQELAFTNTGNRAVNSSVRADGNMHSSLAGFADIASAQTHYSVAQGTAWSAGTAIGTSDSDVPLALPQQQADAGPAPTAPAYFYLKLPTTGIRGTYTNTLFFTAYAP